MVVGVRRQRHPLHDRDPVGLQTLGLGGVVGDQPHRADPQVLEDLGGRTVVTASAGSPRSRLASTVSRPPSCSWWRGWQQPDAAALVTTQVDHHPAALLDDALHRLLQLRAAVAARRPEDVTGEALRVHAAQHRLAAAQLLRVAVHQGDVLGVVDADVVAHGGEVAVPGGSRVVATRSRWLSVRRRWWTSWSIETSRSPCSSAKSRSSWPRFIVPSSLTTSTRTPTGVSPAIRGEVDGCLGVARAPARRPRGSAAARRGPAGSAPTARWRSRPGP